MSFVRYIVTIAIDPNARESVMLVKMKGPAFLLGKITFPGGKLEAGETPEQGATRELAEETGLVVLESAWKPVSIHNDEHYELHVLAAASAQVREASQLEAEPVFHGNLDEAAATAQQHPERYTPDFLPFLKGALAALGLNPLSSVAQR